MMATAFPAMPGWRANGSRRRRRWAIPKPNKICGRCEDDVRARHGVMVATHAVEHGGLGCPDVAHGRCAFLHSLTPAYICRSISGAAPVEVGGVRLQASQALASDHMVETTCSSRGRDVRRITDMVRRMTPPSL